MCVCVDSMKVKDSLNTDVLDPTLLSEQIHPRKDFGTFQKVTGRRNVSPFVCFSFIVAFFSLSSLIFKEKFVRKLEPCCKMEAEGGFIQLDQNTRRTRKLEEKEQVQTR